MNLHLYRPWWLLAWCSYTRTHARLKRDRQRYDPLQTQWVCTYKKKIYFHVSAPHDLVGLPELITELSKRNRRQWKADMTLRLSEPTWKHSAIRERERGRRGRGWYCKNQLTELSADSNENCTGLHNLRLMRKQQQMKSPPPFLSRPALLYRGAFH